MIVELEGIILHSLPVRLSTYYLFSQKRCTFTWAVSQTGDDLFPKTQISFSVGGWYVGAYLEIGEN